MYVQFTCCFQEDVKKPIEQILLNNNMFKVSNKYTETRCEISSSLTTERTSLTWFLGLYC